MADFKFDLGDEAKDTITGFAGVIVSRTQWLNNCNTYGLQPKKLDSATGKIQERDHFDELQLKLVKAKTIKPSRKTGGPSRPVMQTIRL